MGIELGYALIQDIFLDTIIFNTTWIISIALTLIILVSLTRDKNKWKTLALPVLTGLHISGIPPFILFYIIAAITFTIEVLSLSTINSMIETVSQTGTGIITLGKRITRSEERQQQKRFEEDQRTQMLTQTLNIARNKARKGTDLLKNQFTTLTELNAEKRKQDRAKQNILKDIGITDTKSFPTPTRTQRNEILTLSQLDELIKRGNNK